MPEGPEVTVITRGLNILLANKSVVCLDFLQNSRYFNCDDEDIRTKFRKMIAMEMPVITAIKCVGKFLWFEFANGWHLWQTFGLTGGWRINCLDKKNGVVYNPAIKLTYRDQNANQQDIYYCDHTRFGTLTPIPPAENPVQQLSIKLATLGIDILSAGFTYDAFAAKLGKIKKRCPEKPICLVLDNQKYFAGIGNYLRSEILYNARINPHKQIDKLTDQEIHTLYNSIRLVYTESLDAYGAHIDNYSDITSILPQLAEYKIYTMKVYGRLTDVMGYKITVEKMAGDSQCIYWVPAIQK